MTAHENPTFSSHIYHCCKRHGCKYGYAACPVVTSNWNQEYPCEYCQPVNEAIEITKEAIRELIWSRTIFGQDAPQTVDVNDYFPDIAAKYTDYITPWMGKFTVYGCDNCGCLFMPSFAADEIYPDRFQPREGCQSLFCSCHLIPNAVKPDGTELTINKD